MKWPGGSGWAGLLILICFAFPALRGQVSATFLQEHGQRLERLFSELDPDNPAIAEIQAIWKAGDRATAASALCAFYRNKAFPLDVLDAPLIPANFIEHAEAAIRAEFFLLNEWEQAALTPAGGIDWAGRGPRNDKERAWMLNRHAFFLSLAEAGERTGEQRFARSLNLLCTDWILANPYPNRLTFSAPWRALEVARRIVNSWVYVFYGYDVLDDETRLLMLSSVLDHADALLEHTSFWGGNHLITEKLALLATAAAWPEFKGSGHWRDNAVAAISREFLSQTYPDGSYKELSNHYQRVVLTNTTKFLKLLEAVGRSTADQAVVRRIGEMWDFFAGVMRPDGFGPLNNAADAEHNAAYLKEVWQRFGRPDWLHMASNGRAGTPPAEGPSRLFPYAGQAILRTGWERDAGWVYFDAGPYGTAHQHVDRLHVSAALKGRPLLVDNGRYTYQPGPCKDYFQGPASHNILLLDGQPAKQAPRAVAAPLPVAFSETGSTAFAAASARFFPPAAHPLLPSLTSPTPWTRAVLLDNQGRFVLILDHVVTFRSQNWTAQWHFHPEISAAQATRALTLVSPPDSVRSLVRIGAAPPNVAGFHSPEYNLKQPAVQMDVSGNLDRPTTLVWLLQSPSPDPLSVEVISKLGAPVLHLRVMESHRAFAEIRVQLHPEPILLSCTVF